MSANPDIALAAARSIVSRIIGEGRGKNGRDIYYVRSALHWCESAPEEPPARLPRRPHPLTRGNLSRLDLVREWDQLRVKDGALASFDATLIEEFIEDRYLGVLSKLFADGPDSGVRQIELALFALARHSIAKNLARPDGGFTAPGTLRNYAQTYRRVIRKGVELGELGHPWLPLRKWRAVPPIRLPDTAPANVDRSAPPFRQVRRRCHEGRATLALRLECEDGDLRGAVGRIPAWKLRLSGAWRLAGDLVVLSLLATVGPRADALAELRVSDYDPKRLFADGSGESGPAIRLKPGKTNHEELERWKGIGDEEAELIEVRIRISTRLYTELDGWKVRSHPIEMPTDWYLLAGSTVYPTRRPNPQTISRRVGGTKWQRPLLPEAPLDSENDGPPFKVRGHSAHRLRRRAFQGIKGAAEKEIDARGLRGISAEAVVAAALDHDIPGDALGYADVSSEPGRERWARFGIRAASKELWQRDGAILVPDASRFESALRAAEALDAARVASIERLEQLSSSIREKGPHASNGDVAGLLTAMEEESRLREKLLEANSMVTRLREDRSTFIELPDDAEPEAQSVDLSEIEARVRGNGQVTESKGSSVRDWVTVTEFADALSVVTATARRWVKGDLPHAAGDPRNPWEAEAIPVDETCGVRRRRIWIGGIKSSALSVEQKDALAALTQRWPTGNWSPENCRAPLELPARGDED